MHSFHCFHGRCWFTLLVLQTWTTCGWTLLWHPGYGMNLLLQRHTPIHTHSPTHLCSRHITYLCLLHFFCCRLCWSLWWESDRLPRRCQRQMFTSNVQVLPYSVVGAVSPKHHPPALVKLGQVGGERSSVLIAGAMSTIHWWYTTLR